MSDCAKPEDIHRIDWEQMYAGDVSDYTKPDPDLLKMAARLPVGSVLDVGCGAGGLIAALAERGWRATGIDLSGRALAASRAILESRGLDATLVRGDITTWRPHGRFDLVTNSFALPLNAAERDGAFRSMAAALRPGGVMLLREHDASMSRQPVFAPYELVSVGEMRAAFAEFTVLEAGTHEYDLEAEYRSDPQVPELWTAAVFYARKPSSEER